MIYFKANKEMHFIWKNKSTFIINSDKMGIFTEIRQVGPTTQISNFCTMSTIFQLLKILFNDLTH